jgi:hypothetical protein
MSKLAALIERIDDHLNPIIVKELRQVVRGKFFWGILVLFLGFQCAVLSLSITNQKLTSASSGSDALTFLFSVLFLGCFALIPLYSGFRFSKERSESNEELLYITTITPHSIIRGKFAATMAFILLLFSAFAPFMAMTFFLSGVDMPLMFLILFLGLLVCSAATIFQLTLGSLAKDTNLFNILRGFGLFVQVTFFFSLMSVVADIVRFGSARFFGVANSAAGILTFVFLLLGFIYFAYLAAAAVTSPPTANKMQPIRKFLTVYWALSLLVAIYWMSISVRGEGAILAWGFFSIIATNFMVVVAVCERDYLTRRAAKSLPKNPFLVRLVFLFSSGAASGLAWCLLLLLGTILIVTLAAYLLPLHGMTFSMRSDFYKIAFGFSGYIFAYALLASFIRRVFLAEFVSVRNTWVIGLILCAVFALAPMFLGIFTGSSADLLMLGNPMSVFSYRSSDSGVVFAFVVAIIGFIINLPWLYRQARQYFDAVKVENKISETRQEP